MDHTRPNAEFNYSGVTHAYGTDGVYQIKICAADDDTTNNCTTQNVTITNVAPTVPAIVTNGPKPENTAVTVSGTITDPGWLDVLSATINWGDGTATAALAGSGENIRPTPRSRNAVNHTYGDDGTFTITSAPPTTNERTTATTRA